MTRLARGLVALGVEPGDRVALVSESRPEWVVADLAIMSIGAVTVPAYTTNTVEDHRHILGNSGARAAIVSTPALAARLHRRRPSRCRACARSSRSSRAGLTSASAVDAACLGRRCWRDAGETPTTMCRARVAALAPDDTACLIYTSGTGGVPKGVMLSHRNIIGNCRGAYRLLEHARPRRRGVPVAFCRCRIPTSTPPG